MPCFTSSTPCPRALLWSRCTLALLMLLATACGDRESDAVEGDGDGVNGGGDGDGDGAGMDAGDDDAGEDDAGSGKPCPFLDMGTEDCPCNPNGDCAKGLECDEGADEGPRCICRPGVRDCPCRTVEGMDPCNAGSICNEGEDVCVCVPGELGCQCLGGTGCGDALTCEAGVCRGELDAGQ